MIFSVRKTTGLILGLCLVLMLGAVEVQAQSKKRIIQLSGIVSDSVQVLPLPSSPNTTVTQCRGEKQALPSRTNLLAPNHTGIGAILEFR